MQMVPVYVGLDYHSDTTRVNGEQLGHAPEYLAERIVNELDAGYTVVGLLLEITGGTFDKPTRGANFVVFFVADDIAADELNSYANDVLATRT